MTSTIRARASRSTRSPSTSSSAGVAGAVVTTDGHQVTFTPPAGFVGVRPAALRNHRWRGWTAASVIAYHRTCLPGRYRLRCGRSDHSAELRCNDIDVLANDVDPAGGGLTVTAASVTASLPKRHARRHDRRQQGSLYCGRRLCRGRGGHVYGNRRQQQHGHGASSASSSCRSTWLWAPCPCRMRPSSRRIRTRGHRRARQRRGSGGGGLIVTAASVTASVPVATHACQHHRQQGSLYPRRRFCRGRRGQLHGERHQRPQRERRPHIVVSPLALGVGPVAIPDARWWRRIPRRPISTWSPTTSIGRGRPDRDRRLGDGLGADRHARRQVVGNKVRFTPAAGFAGVVVVIYTATDVNNQAETGVLNNSSCRRWPWAQGRLRFPIAAVVAQGSPATISTSWPTTWIRPAVA